jgi:subtilisin family serine protease
MNRRTPLIFIMLFALVILTWLGQGLNRKQTGLETSGSTHPLPSTPSGNRAAPVPPQVPSLAASPSATLPPANLAPPAPAALSPATRPDPSTRSDREPTPAELAAGFRFDRLIAKPQNRLLAAPGFPARSAAALAASRVTDQSTFSRLGGLQTLALDQADGTRADLETRLAALQASGLYDYVEPDFIRTTSRVANDPRYVSGELWGLHNTGQEGGTADADIDAPEAWDLLTGAPSVVVAVIDTGVRYTHEDLAANMWTNLGEIPGNGIDDDNNGYIDDIYGIDARNRDSDPMDDHRHGTHCAGTVAAVGNNGKGVVGVAWQARIMALKFLSGSGSGNDTGAIECIDYAIANGAQILSCSFGGTGYGQALRDVIIRARQAGILVIAAAGNDSENLDTDFLYPAAYQEDNVIAVAATDRNDQLADFSNYGQGKVEIAAPGVAILSTGRVSDQDYFLASGTSMATPHVAGAFALLRSRFPTDTPRQLVNRLQNSADRLPALNGKVQFGARLNLNAALRSTNNRPANDPFSTPAVVSGPAVHIRASLAGASTEPGEPMHAGDLNQGPTLWWQWSPTETGQVTFDLTGSAPGTRLAIYSGNTFNQLTPEATLLLDTNSQVTLNAVLGNIYRIAVAGPVDANGRVELRIGPIPYEAESPRPTKPPVNDNFDQAAELKAYVPVDESDPDYKVDGWNRGNLWTFTATKEPGEPNHAKNPGGNSVWFKWTAPADGRYTANTSFSVVDHPNTLLAVYTGTRVDQLTLVAENDDSPPDRLRRGDTAAEKLSWLLFDAVAGTTYYFAVDGYNNGSGPLAGAISLYVTYEPIGDTFASEVPVEGNTFTASTMGATWEKNEPVHFSEAEGFTVWRTWIAPATGRYLVQGTKVASYTAKKSTSAGFTVYEGDSLATLTKKSSPLETRLGTPMNPAAWSSYVDAIAGRKYRIVVDNVDQSFSETTLTLDFLDRKDNDGISGAPTLPLNGRSSYGNNLNATMETFEAPLDDQRTKSLWWKFTAPSVPGIPTISGALLIAHRASQYNGTPLVQVFYSPNGLADSLQFFGQAISSDKDNTNMTDYFSGTASFPIFPGGTYYVRIVESAGGAGGVVGIKVRIPPILVDDYIAPASPGYPIFVDVLANDLSPSGTTLSIKEAVMDSGSGNIQRTPTGLVFTPDNQITTGPACIRYTVVDGLYERVGYAYVYANERSRLLHRRFGDAYVSMTFSNTGDANGNGVPNLLEYALGGDPADPTTAPLVHPWPEVNPQTSRLKLVVNRYLARTDLTLTVQAADSPGGPWTDIARSTGGNAFTALVTGTGIIETGTGDARQVTITDPISGPRRFIRLKVDSTP